MRKVTNPYILEELTPEISWSLGWLLSDGHLTKDNKISIEIQKSDHKVLEKIEEALELNHSLYYRSNRDTCRLSFTSKNIAEDMIELGFPTGKKSKIAKPLNIPDKFLPQFFQGNFEGDGSVYSTKEPDSYCERPGINFVGSKAMCKGMKEYLNIPTKILSVGGSYIVKRQCKDPAFWLDIFNKLYDDYMIENGFFLQRKYYFLKNLVDTFIYYERNNI